MEENTSMKAIEIALTIQRFFLSWCKTVRSWLGLKSLLPPGVKYHVWQLPLKEMPHSKWHLNFNLN